MSIVNEQVMIKKMKILLMLKEDDTTYDELLKESIHLAESGFIRKAIQLFKESTGDKR